MEDIHAYIQSGILELYVLGDISPEETLLVEEMFAKHPVLKTELEEVEKALELYAKFNAVEPSENHRNKILNNLLTNLADDSIFPSKKEKTADNIIAMPPPQAIGFFKFAFAASVTLLICSLVALFNVYNKLQQSNSQLAALNSQNLRFAKTVSHMDDQLNVFRDTTFRLLRLKGTAKTPSSRMTVAWSPVKKKVMIDMVDMKLPENDKTHQYQLWALVGGKPVDLGVFDKTNTDTSDMKPMKPVALANAFAVTLEPRGGSINPTMSEMMVIGQY